jgi:hypothetical protein
MGDPLTMELATVLGRLKREHDMLPFLGQLLPAMKVRLAPLPDTMLDQLCTSPDFSSIRPGEPVWLSLVGPDDEMAELVVYRTEANGQHFVIAPQAE